MGENFLDDPFIAPWMPEEERLFRQQTRNYLVQAGEKGILQAGNLESAKIFRGGESSVVFLVEGEKERPFVVKMARTPGVIESEVTFFENWAREGVKTPVVLSFHSADVQFPISLVAFEYITDPVLSMVSDSSIRVESDIAREMGTTLAKMHRAKGQGFGRPQSRMILQGIYQTFREEMEEQLFNEKAAYLIEQGVIGDTDLALARKAVAIIEDDLSKGVRPSLTHNDLRPYNIFATRPITVFDPSPRIDPPAVDLALTLLKAELESETHGKEEAEEILRGYQKISQVKDRVLSAAKVLRGIALLNTWHRKGKTRKVERLTQLVRQQHDM